MAVYSEDWSGSTIGQEPTGWTKRWAQTGVTWEVVDRPSAMHGRALQVTRTASTRAILSHDAASNDTAQTNFKMRALVQLADSYGSTSPAMSKMAARASNTAGSETGYTVGPGSRTGNLTVRHARYQNGDFTITAGSTEVFAYGGKYWIELEVSDTSTYIGRAYAENDTSFSNPLLVETHTDTNITAAGWMGLFGFTEITSGAEYWEDVVFATGGDPLPPVGTVVKGVRVRLYDSAGTPVASETDIQVSWFDQPEPKDFLAPEFVTATASTDADGWLEVNLDSATALNVGDPGFLLAYKLNAATPNDSPVFASRMDVEDIQ